MKKLIFLFLFQISYSHCQVDWLVSVGGPYDDYANDVVCDNLGFNYCVGIFTGVNVNFAETGTYLESTSPTNQFNGFIRKSSSDGVLEWVKILSSRCNIRSIEVKNATESNSGYFIISGFYFGTVNFAPGELTVQSETSSNVQDMFVAKYDLQGNYIWHKVYGGYGNDEVEAISIDNQDNILFYGHFNSSIDFGNGNAFTTNVRNGVIHKIDKYGNDIWTVRLTSPIEIHPGGGGIDTDSEDNVCVTGVYSGNLILNSGENLSTIHPETINYDRRGFIIKLNSSSNYIWSRVYGSDSLIYINNSGGKGNISTFDLKIDSHDAILVTGNSTFNVSFAPNAEINGGIYGNAFVLKLNANGDFNWLNSFGGEGLDYGMEIDLDLDDNIYSTGTLQHTGDLDPSIDSMMVDTGGDCIFVQKTDSNGVFIDAKGFGSSCDMINGQGIAVDQNQNVFIAGNFDGYGWTYWNPPYGDIQLNDYGENDAILFKLGGHLTLQDNVMEDVLIYPNPATSYFKIKNYSDYESIAIFDVYGKTIFFNNNIEEEVNCIDWESGIYFVKLYKDDNSVVLQLIKN